MINPILKKPLLDKEIFSNYRPVSNLTYVSKLMEHVIAKQLIDHLESNNLAETFQSAYKQYHSTETVLTSVTNNILTALDRRQAVLLVLLDLSAAFDTVDHSVLLRRLEVRVGSQRHGIALDEVLFDPTLPTCIRRWREIIFSGT